MLPKMRVAAENLSPGSKRQHRQPASPGAASDDVSTAIAGIFASHRQDIQKLAGQATAFHDQFIQALTGSANAYAYAEAAIAAVVSAATAEPNYFENPWTTLVWLGAVALSPLILVSVLGFLSTLLATYWTVTFLGTVFG